METSGTGTEQVQFQHLTVATALGLSSSANLAYLKRVVILSLRKQSWVNALACNSILPAAALDAT